MTKNKSIDGLTARVAKKAAPLHSGVPSAARKSPQIAHHKQATSSELTVAEPIIVHKTKPNKKPVTKTTTIASKSHEQAIADFIQPVQAFNLDHATNQSTPSQSLSETTDPSTKHIKSHKSPKASKPKHHKHPSKVRRIITTIALIIVLGLTGLIVGLVLWGNDIIAKITGGQGTVFDLITFIEPTYDPLRADANGRTNILAFGTSGYDMSGDEGNGVHAGAQLTDSIMVISLNQETGDIAMLSLPRDLKASPTCTATGKINEVYWCNGGSADASTEQEATAATALMTEVGSILGIDFQYFIHLNWGSLVSVVDLLGGIEVTLDEDINDRWWTGAVYQAGVTYTLNGEEALGLARARHGTLGGDFSRGASQQKILIGIKNKVLEKQFSITDFLSLASTLGDNLRSNFSIEELKSAAHLTLNFDFDTMRQISLWPDYMTTGTLDNSISYVFPRAGVGNYGVIQTYVAEQLANDPRVYEQPTIAIFNATEQTGLASSEAATLTDLGYKIHLVDNAPEDTFFTHRYTIYQNSDKTGTAEMLQQYYNVNLTTISEAPESITRDYDFVIVLGPSPDNQ